MANIIVRNYEHYNRTLGKYISSKASYEKEMARQGMVSWEVGEQLAEKARKANHKDYDGLSKQAMEVCKAAKDQADNKGRLTPSTRLIDGMKKTGVCFELPKHYRDLEISKGGFSG
jgi:type III secretory pathway component EscV